MMIYSNIFHESDAEPFDLFNYGLNIFGDGSFSEEFEEKIRHFSEECDLIQVRTRFFKDALNLCVFLNFNLKGLSNDSRRFQWIWRCMF